MRILLLLLCVLLLCVLVFPAGAAEDPHYDDMLKKARNLNVTLPEKGTALLGSKESMTEMVDWLNACTDAMITFVNDVMDVSGAGNTSFAQNMKKTLETGRTLSPARTGK